MNLIYIDINKKIIPAKFKMIVDVLLPIHTDKLFSYKIGKTNNIPKIGNLVEVDFKGKNKIGIIWRYSDEKIKIKNLKKINKVFPNISLNNNIVESWLLIAKYSCNSVASILKLSISNFNPKILISDQKSESIYKFKNFLFNKHNLNDEQKRAVFEINRKPKSIFSAILLHGVTGSGKTRVYMDVLEDILNKNQQCIVLVPEIILTKQWIKEFKSIFGFQPEIFHSSISKKKKEQIWLGIATSKIKLVIGTRSALFLPYQNLGLIVLDEEHDISYKQEDGIIINARDMAVLIAKKTNSLIILSSATPSLETLYNCTNKKYSRLSLTQRVNNYALPKIEIIDMKKEKRKNFWISEKLEKEIKKTISENQQSLIFLNKRGYSPVMLCKKCGKSEVCPHCDFSLVFHKGIFNNNKNLLLCHHCNYQIEFKNECTSCKAKDSFITVGPGVEKIFEEVSSLFPQAKICLLSSDTLKKREEHNEILSSIYKNEVDIIIGTQIISKGHHFPNIKTVGIINIDNLLKSIDIRANEKAYQLLTQVSGRAGRAANNGKVFIQTFLPDNKIIKMASEKMDLNFYNWELCNRKRLNHPPFSNLISVIIREKNLKTLQEHSKLILSKLKKFEKINIYGPAPAPIFKLKNIFRYRLLILFESNFVRINQLKNELMSIKKNRFLDIKIDVDPQSFF